jgi:alanine racemase
MEVDLEALTMNYREVERMVGPDIKIIASVKGNGYGMGVARTARSLQRLGVYAVATGSFKDAMAIRNAGLNVKVQMFPGNLSMGVAELLRHDLMSVARVHQGRLRAREAWYSHRRGGDLCQGGRGPAQCRDRGALYPPPLQ